MNKVNAERSSLIFLEGLNLLQSGKTEEADALFAKANQLSPDNIDVINILGVRSYQKQDYKNALLYLNRADSLSPNSVQTLSNIGLVYHAIYDYKSALDYFKAALKIKTDIPEIYNNIGNTYKKLHNSEEAKNSYLKAIELRPIYAEALSNYATVFLEEGNIEKAIELFNDSIRANPNFAVSFNNLGNALTQIEHYEDAFDCFEKAIQIRPNYFDAYLNYGNSLRKCKYYNHAIECFNRALAINKTSDEVLYALGEVYYDLGELDQARTHYQKCLVISPNNLKARHALAIANLPKVYQNCGEIWSSRMNFVKELEILETIDRLDASKDMITAAISRHPFYLAYQDENNEPLLSQYGEMCRKEAKIIQPTPKFFKSNISDRIRLGIVSNYFCNHPVWQAITKSVVLQIDKTKFEIFLFHTDGKIDSETDLAKLNAAEFINCGRSVHKAASIICESCVDVLIYPEIGMDPTSRALACFRLAPTQIASWGHPETTGLPTIDFFITGELLEPINAEKNYREKLISLPNLGTYVYEFKLQTVVPELDTFGISKEKPILLCPGSPSKYSPVTDSVLINIAKQIETCQLVFFNFDNKLTEQLKNRLNNLFIKEGLPPNNHIHFLPFLKSTEFFGLMSIADLYLDTIGFSGFNTALQAISCNLPIVTIDGTHMRGRLASAILKRMGLSEYVCDSEESYVDLAIQLIRNPTIRATYKEKIAASKHIPFKDQEPIKKLEKFLISKLEINN